MIHVDRNRVPRPKALAPSRVRKYLEGYEKRRKLPSRWLDAKADLFELFHGKCAFCERGLHNKMEGDVEHFRPKGGVLTANGQHLKSHYPWLAYEWTNLYLICRTCNFAKRDRFPIDGEYCEVGADPKDLADEKPLLLDPCVDYPESALVFDDRGFVSGETEQARVTIDIFDLNRSELAKERLMACKRAAAADDPQVGDEQPFAAAIRQYILRRRPDLADLRKEQFARTRKVSTEESEAKYEAYQAHVRSQDDYSVEDDSAVGKMHSRRRVVTRIELENIRVHKELDLQLHGSLEGGWTMILGENGTGKSTVLHALALALVGSRAKDVLGIELGGLVRRGAAEGMVRVHISGSSDPVVLRVKGDDAEIIEGGDSVRFLLLAYGATRLLPRLGHKPPDYGSQFIHVKNLFDPFLPLADATKWATTEISDSVFYDTVAPTLGRLLGLSESEKVDRRDDSLIIQHHDSCEPLERESDGYQVMVALACDIFRVMLERSEELAVAEGIVLLDEIGAHLHPRWQMRVVQSFREALPNVQFIATTHNPLCLRGMQDGEIIVMARDDQNGVVPITDLPPISSLRTDQILTSEHFGLSSAYDPRYERLFERYYELLRKSRKSKKDHELIRRCREVLESLELMGVNRRERLMLEAIDRYLADKPELLDIDERRERRRRLDTELDTILEEVGA